MKAGVFVKCVGFLIPSLSDYTFTGAVDHAQRPGKSDKLGRPGLIEWGGVLSLGTVLATDGWSEDDKKRWRFQCGTGPNRTEMQWRDGFTSIRCLTTSDATKVKIICSVRADCEGSSRTPKPIFSCNITPVNGNEEEEEVCDQSLDGSSESLCVLEVGLLS